MAALTLPLIAVNAAAEEPPYSDNARALVANPAMMARTPNTQSEPRFLLENVPGIPGMKTPQIWAFGRHTPQQYFIRDGGATVTFGMGVERPVGLAGERPVVVSAGHRGSQSVPVRITPALAWKASDNLSIGGGVKIQYNRDTPAHSIDFSNVCDALGTPCRDPQNAGGEAFDGGLDDAELGYDVGLLYQLSDDTRVGVAYQSPIRVDSGDELNSTAREYFGGIPSMSSGFGQEATAFGDQPGTISLNVRHRFLPQWAIEGGVRWTDWTTVADSSVTARSPQLREDGDDVQESWRYALGLRFLPSDNWSLRTGLAFDQNTTVGADGAETEPSDESRTWLTLGASYNVSNRLQFDVGYAHLFDDDSQADDRTTDPGLRSRESDTNVLGTQFRWNY